MLQDVNIAPAERSRVVINKVFFIVNNFKMVIVIWDCTMQIRILSFLPVFRQISVVQSSPPVIYEDIIHIRSIHSFIAEYGP